MYMHDIMFIIARYSGTGFSKLHYKVDLVLTRWATASGAHGLILDDGAFEMKTWDIASRNGSLLAYCEH